MALIKCPECGKENVSNTAESCPSCGYGIKKHFIKIEQELQAEKQQKQEKTIKSWDDRITAALAKKQTEKVTELLKIGEEGYFSAYNHLGIHYFNICDFNNAYKYYSIALSMSPNDKSVLNNLGWLYAQKEFSKHNIDTAIELLQKSDNKFANNNLGSIYKDKTNPAHFNPDKSIYYYQRALELGYVEGHVLTNIGYLYATYKNLYVLAASYSYLGGKNGCENGTKNFNIYINSVIEKNGSIWEDNIKQLASYKDIERMIERVNSEIVQAKTNKIRLKLGVFQSIQNATISISGDVIWKGKTGQVIELPIYQPTKIKVTYHIGLFDGAGVCEGIIDPNISKKWQVVSHPGFIVMKLSLQPVDLFDAN